mmetsp:Transcript_41991/g.63423  ORF Transcript_41991/g.63423 Transcript_41991/m.63423 type:complete len:388 (+) Transcript_41991:108-1271(+)|eukprot:CAMPEP_0194749486 /NCGR_PEP_ID=MMETSP0323_2-20130528/3655_1 /TAXON_ID=2866 ORGANISM="Crypthecodinium cohnii, Strain Seligo" /NCGR_SAMPLE_ID=MMETSP0323_2 /ASSEMBLY_ACC=CAM_ASM_000346 /LENGTH=387 /DNA_ID=CAMNT_0039664599 /DNA_START=72 /DNA_END=1235 /DNA_ORIENTATION=-
MAGVENRVFVNNVPPDATAEHVEAYFRAFGATSDVYLPLQFGTNRHKGIAYVTFVQVESKDSALQHAPHLILGQEVSVQQCLAKGQGKAPLPGSRASGDNRIFIQGIGQETTQEEVQAHFSRFGTWSDIFMPKGSFTAGHKGICFISFNSPDSVREAMDAAPHVIAGHQVTVDIAVARDAKGVGKGFGGGGYGGFGAGKGGNFVPPPAPAQMGMLGGGMNAATGGQALQQMMEAAEMLYAQHFQQQSGLQYQPRQPAFYPPQPQQSLYQSPPQGLLGSPGRPVAPPAGKVLPGRLFLTKMAPGLNKDDLQNYFSQFGVLNDVYMPAGKLIAFIGYEEPSVATSVASMQTHEVKPGCSVCVEPAIERPGAGGAGGFGGGKGKGRFSPY